MKAPEMRSMRARMTVYFTLVIAAVMAAACFGWSWYAYRSSKAAAISSVRSAARRVIEALDLEAAAMTPPTPGLAGAELFPTPELIEEIGDLNAEGFATVVADDSGSVLSRSRGLAPKWKPGIKEGIDPERRWILSTVPIPRSNGRTLVIGTRWDLTEAGLQRQARVLAAIGVLVVLVTAFGSWALVGSTLSPIARLASQADSAPAETLCVHLVPPSQDAEVVSLVNTLNQLLANLGETAAARARFYAAASHEMRTPLQGLIGHLELAMQRLESNSAAMPRIEEALEQSRRLTGLVQDLLFLNQLEMIPASAESAHAEPVNLGECVQRALDEVRGLIDAGHLRLCVSEDNEIEVRAPATHLSALVRNLVENAAKYCPAGGAIEIEVAPTLRIYNSTDPLDGPTIARLTEPFYRPDPARTRPGGNGLGLAICRSVCSANGWAMTLKPGREGLEIAITFPATQVTVLDHSAK